MALFTTYVQNGAYNAKDDRFTQGATLARQADGKVAPGIIYGNPNDGLVRQSTTAGKNVTVDPFTAVVTDGARGAYIGGLDARTTYPIIEPEASNNRLDLLCWRPLEGLTVDSRGTSTMGDITLADGTVLSRQVVSGEVYFVKGTPSASTSPAAPDVPTDSVPLARVYVAGGTSAITTSNITDARVWTSTVGGPVPGTVTPDAATSFTPGTVVYDASKDGLFYIDAATKARRLTQLQHVEYTGSVLVPDDQTWGTGSLTVDDAVSSNYTTWASVSGESIVLQPGTYVASHVAYSDIAFTGRTFGELRLNNAGSPPLARASATPNVGENVVSVGANFALSAAGTLAFVTYKHTGGSATTTHRLRITRIN